LMERANPLYIARNHLVEEALAAAQSDDLAPLTALVQVLRNPYDFVVGQERYAASAPQDFGAYRTFCGT
jgi:serine/tyrosine/threonine adenylyltransferase